MIYEVTLAGSVSTFATMPANHGAYGMAFNAEGDLFVSTVNDASPNVGAGQIYEVTPSGSVSLFATIPPTTPLFGLAIDAAGDIFVSSNSADGAIYEVTPSGSVSTFVSGLYHPTYMTFGPNGDLYFAAYASSTSANHAIFKVTPTGTVSTFYSGADSNINGMAFTSTGDLLFADPVGDAVVKVTGPSSYSVFATGFSYDPVALAFQPSQPAAVPEPSSLTLLGLGALGLLGCIRRRRGVVAA